jgi:hypothetical protein
MEKKGQLFEIIIKALFFIVAIVACIYLIKDVFTMFPLFSKLYKDNVDFNLIYDALKNTHVRKIFDTVSLIGTDNKISISSYIYSFLVNLPFVSYVFLLLTVALSILYFVFIKWKLLKSYLVVCLSLVGLYVLKYIIFGLAILVSYQNESIRSIVIGLSIGNILYIVVCLFQFFFLSIMILKFIFNISDDLKSYNSY